MWADATGTARAALATIDRRFVVWAAAWTLVALVAFGILTAIIPSPFFVRPIAPEPFALFVWIVSAPLMGLVAATYTVPTRTGLAPPVPLVEGTPLGQGTAPREGTTMGSLAGFGAFLAIGCPICNKVALVLLGTSGAMSVYAPLQPIIGAVSLGLLVVTVAWRLRLRARGTVCAV
jgi:hypothetical protein